jgi:putative SOS response-associated peptidase YedK
MCGRLALQKSDMERMEKELAARWETPRPEPHFNLCPNAHEVPVVLQAEGERTLHAFRWGYIPFWNKQPDPRGHACAVGEEIHSKPSFRHAFKRQRCLIPMTGWFEWQPPAPGERHKRPWWIYPVSEEIITVAGVWDTWRPSPGADPLNTFAVVTVGPNAWMSQIHNRMPVILDASDREAWLDPSTAADDLRSLIRPAPDGILDAYRVSTRLNNPRYDEADILDPFPA